MLTVINRSLPRLLGDGDRIQWSKSVSRDEVTYSSLIGPNSHEEIGDAVITDISHELEDNVEVLILAEGAGDIDGIGNDSRNVILGNEGNNLLDGRGASDLIAGFAGNDTLLGGAGDDDLEGGAGDDSIDGGDGTDLAVFVGSSVQDFRFTESDGVVTVTDLNAEDGDQGTDTLVNVELIVVAGTDGPDTFIAVEGDPQTYAGRGGDDLYILFNVEDVVVEKPEEGNDTVESTVSRTLEENVENLVLTGVFNREGIGNELDNVLTGNLGDNRLEGLVGEDIIDGGPGADIMVGGAGSDTYFVDNPNDKVIEETVEFLSAAQGRSFPRNQNTDFIDHAIEPIGDTIFTRISRVVDANVESLVLSEDAGPISGTGNALGNILIGNVDGNLLDALDGDDQIDGGEGNDTIIGGSGDDDIFGGPGLDRAIYFGNRADYALVRTKGSFTVNDLGTDPEDDGSDFLSSIEILQFADGDLNLVNVVDPDNDGLFWNSSLMLFDGVEVSAEECQLYRTYSGALGRVPDNDGFNWWLQEIREGRRDLFEMAADFIWSQEFLTFFGAPDGNSIDNSEFINHMYSKVFGRSPDQAGYDFWLDELESGARSQALVLVEMTQSNEYVEQTLGEAVSYLFG